MSHATDRALSRHGLILSGHDLGDIREIIRIGYAAQHVGPWIHTKSGAVRNYIVQYRDVLLPLVINETGGLVTVLPNTVYGEQPWQTSRGRLLKRLGLSQTKAS